MKKIMILVLFCFIVSTQVTFAMSDENNNQDDTYCNRVSVPLYTEEQSSLRLKPTGEIMRIGNDGSFRQCLEAYYATKKQWNDFGENVCLHDTERPQHLMEKIKNTLTNIEHYGISKELDAGHNRRMRLNIEQILAIYLDDIHNFVLFKQLGLDNSSDNLELQRLIAISDELTRKHTSHITPDTSH